MRCYAALLVLVAGCQSAQPLAWVAVKAIHDDDLPTRVVLQVTNMGDETVRIEAVPPIITLKSVLYDDDFTGEAPPEFDYRMTLLDDGKPLPDGATIPVAVGETAELVAELQWQLPDDAPPMLGIIQATFIAAHGRRTFSETDPVAFVVQSRPGALDLVVHATEANDEIKRRAFGILSQYSGSPSPGFEALCTRLTGKGYQYSIGPAAPSSPGNWFGEPSSSGAGDDGPTKGQ